ncbi:membrane protein [Caldalkalibacillus thermarum]|uniref:FUSC family protein n=1 Tax=Caldalkalibacillus thermarum TaxID=296745 RepID=UPI001666E2A7|nr:aromatic acid exporter family protein [Caldalkalibacillus thermarum]GGK28154.1 membrane protein [Caldalkalibacillus thermarum]
MRLGARIIKTGIAVTLSLYLATLFKMEPVIFAALAAVLAIQPSLYRSWQNVLEQLQANVIGAVLAVSFTYLLGNEPIVVGLVVVIIIAINLQLGFERSIPLAIVTVIAIMEWSEGSFLLFALDRFLLILLGIGSAVIVNAAFLPPKYEERLYHELNKANYDILSYLRSSTLDELNDRKYREEVKRIKDLLKKIDQLYSLYKEERTYFRKVTYTKQRKLVLFRKMIQANQKGFALLQSIEKHKTKLAYVPPDLKALLQKEIDILTNYHERILLKYERKLRPHHPHVIPTDVVSGRDQVLTQFMALYKENQEKQDEDWIHLFPLFAQLIDYADTLKRLDKLVESYYSFHEA